MNYDRRASSPLYPTLAEAMENAFQGWCLSVVLYGLRDDYDFVFDNQSMKRGGSTFSIDGFPRDRDHRPDALRRFQINFTLKGDKIAAEAFASSVALKFASKHWSFDGKTHYDDVAKAMASFLSTLEFKPY